MTVANGRALLAIPGPTNIPDRVLQAMIRPAEEIYTGAMVDLTDGLLNDLRRVFRTKARTYIYAANGHGGWEAAISNVLSRGDKVLVLASGRFAIGWGEMARFMGADVEVLEGSWRGSVDPAAVEDRLRRDTQHAIKAVLMVQIDTASGVVNDVAAVRKAIDAAGHPALYMVDGVASVACMPFEMDAWGVDVAMSASQKGLMTPPGLAFVAANDKAHAAHERAGMKTLYWDWTARQQPPHYMKYCGTPPEHHLFALRAALDMIFEEGLEAVWRRHALLAQATHAAVGRWAEGQVLGFNVTEPGQRAASVTPVLVQGVAPTRIAEFTEKVCGVTLGSGIGELADKAFRIAHMGHVNAAMVIGALGAIETALKALDIPHGAGGVDAAVAALAAGTGAVQREAAAAS
ncbi:pyridoxal-phosphate-dependent aminotransferase family protein [Phreatobacter sp. AB_2022a]|uniref:pyridoxal-phosphate-dependent aminotransferase family protein n=1 Tax=Phreatobacter sp. AB_2022a TaxID=3003134 RepID=UPI0022870400|nr:aminotransferase class V-fold PLP-dependent enzyme [Phreatobacter sp. AB_2022a]MCZ0733053.1 aminotransferase class V-fold PLP-dependent enzyme [Phreatobacter sp. AB_2022a]